MMELQQRPMPQPGTRAYRQQEANQLLASLGDGAHVYIHYCIDYVRGGIADFATLKGLIELSRQANSNASFQRTQSKGVADALKVLGLSGNPGRGEIESAYRRQARQHHPDFGGDHARMQQINNAREVLLRELR